MDLKLIVKKGVVTITLNRPEKRNAINKAIRDGLIKAMAKIESDEEIKVVILTGAGTKSFSSGADLFETKSRKPFEKRYQVKNEAANTIRNCSKPVIAMMKGYVLGGGLEMALASDIRIAADNTILGFPEIKRGWIPAGGGGTQVLPRLVGEGNAMRLILGGEFIEAKEALRIGLVDIVYPLEELEKEVYNLAEKMTTRRLQALQLGKSAIKLASRTNLDIGLEYEKELITLCYTFPDREEGIQAFKEGRDTPTLMKTNEARSDYND